MYPSQSTSLLGDIYQQESYLAKRNFQAAKDATNTNVIPHVGFNQAVLNGNTTGRAMDSVGRSGAPASEFISLLSGQPTEAFHGNMMPFFKGNHVQNVREDAFSNRLGRFTGQDETYQIGRAHV